MNTPKAIPGHLGYFIDENGVIWSALTRHASGYGGGSFCTVGHRLKKLKWQRGKGNYPTVCLRQANGKRRPIAIHRLVLLTFVGSCPPGNEARHLDGSRSPKLSNLAWGTKKENGQDKIRHGVAASKEKNGNAKLIASQVARIRQLCLEGVSHSAIARQFGIWPGTVSQICRRKTWR